jgi:hypothetical protein
VLTGALIGIAAAAGGVFAVRVLRCWLTCTVVALPAPVRIGAQTVLPAQRARFLQVLGLTAALLALPVLVEPLADPIRSHSAFAGALLRSAIVVTLLATCAILIWGGRRLERRLA